MLNRMFKHYSLMTKQANLKDVTIHNMMEYKGFNVFMNEFKLMSTIVSADEMLQIFNLLIN